MEQDAAMQQYLATIIPRLNADGFKCATNVEHEWRTLALVAKRSRIELAKFGNAESMFILANLQAPDVNLLRSFSRWCFNYAIQIKESPLPCGFFEAVTCYPVALVEEVPAETVNYIRTQPAPKHYGAFEFPVIKDLRTNNLYHLEKTPMWGAAYYNGFRQTAQRLLG